MKRIAKRRLSCLLSAILLLVMSLDMSAFAGVFEKTARKIDVFSKTPAKALISRLITSSNMALKRQLRRLFAILFMLLLLLFCYIKNT